MQGILQLDSNLTTTTTKKTRRCQLVSVKKNSGKTVTEQLNIE